MCATIRTAYDISTGDWSHLDERKMSWGVLKMVLSGLNVNDEQ